MCTVFWFFQREREKCTYIIIHIFASAHRKPCAKMLLFQLFKYYELCQRSSMPNKHFLLDGEYSTQGRPIEMRATILCLPNHWMDFKMLLTPDRFWDLVVFLFLIFPWILWSIEQFVQFNALIFISQICIEMRAAAEQPQPISAPEKFSTTYIVHKLKGMQPINRPGTKKLCRIKNMITILF